MSAFATPWSFSEVPVLLPTSVECYTCFLVGIIFPRPEGPIVESVFAVMCLSLTTTWFFFFVHGPRLRRL